MIESSDRVELEGRAAAIGPAGFAAERKSGAAMTGDPPAMDVRDCKFSVRPRSSSRNSIRTPAASVSDRGGRNGIE